MYTICMNREQMWKHIMKYVENSEHIMYETRLKINQNKYLPPAKEWNPIHRFD